MSRKTIGWIIVVVVVAVAGGGAMLVVNHNSSNNPGTSMSGMDMSPPSSTNSPSKTPAATNSVAIQNFAFSPADITVKAGTTVTWANQDSATHTVTSTSGPKSFDSGDLATGKKYSFTFNTPGTYKYHCSIHPDMLGTVTVTE